MKTTLAVIWEDPHGLAIVKPAGMLTQGGGPDEVTVERLIRSYLNPDDPASAYLGTVHRLDRPVSGVMLWAKTPKAARRWADQFARREARKEYWAIVEGEIPDSGTWDDWLTSPDASGRARVAGSSRPGAVRAMTRFEADRDQPSPDGCTRVRLWPETGRTHQLRAQSSSRGAPIVGDSTYGSARSFPIGIALHARSLTVEHPIARRPIVFEAPLPDSWQDGSVSRR